MSKPQSKPPAVFYGKTWIYYAQALVATGLDIMCLSMGPMFLLGIMKNAQNKPVPEAGIALTIFGVILLPVALLAWFNILARRKPLIKLCKQGIAVNVIGASDADGVRLIPGVVRVAWLIVTGQGFRSQAAMMNWPALTHVEVKGVSVVKSLHIYGAFTMPGAKKGEAERTVQRLSFRDAEFRTSPDKVAEAIEYYRNNTADREQLPSL